MSSTGDSAITDTSEGILTTQTPIDLEQVIFDHLSEQGQWAWS